MWTAVASRQLPSEKRLPNSINGSVNNIVINGSVNNIVISSADLRHRILRVHPCQRGPTAELHTLDCQAQPLRNPVRTGIAGRLGKVEGVLQQRLFDRGSFRRLKLRVDQGFKFAAR